jgi:hypothetical protein
MRLVLCFSTSTSLASLRTFRCWDTAGLLMPNSSQSCPAVRRPRFNSSRIRLRFCPRARHYRISSMKAEAAPDSGTLLIVRMPTRAGGSGTSMGTSNSTPSSSSFVTNSFAT